MQGGWCWRRKQGSNQGLPECPRGESRGTVCGDSLVESSEWWQKVRRGGAIGLCTWQMQRISQRRTQGQMPGPLTGQPWSWGAATWLRISLRAVSFWWKGAMDYWKCRSWVESRHRDLKITESTLHHQIATTYWALTYCVPGTMWNKNSHHRRKSQSQQD